MNDRYKSPTGPGDVCSFCDRDQSHVKRLVAGPSGVHICDDCIELAYSFMFSKAPSDEADGLFQKFPAPAEIMKSLDQYVIGQEKAKKKISVAVYNHYKRIALKDKSDVVELTKSNILLIGPTGTGKTLIAQTLARILAVPFAIADATTLTEAGYVGEDVENIILKLYQNADGNIGKTQKGIIYIDEIDKISRKADSPSITRDVSGEGVQQALLKIIEGTEANVPPLGGRKHPQQEYIKIDTTDILFICGGTFIGLEKIIQHRLGKSSVGFKSSLARKDLEKTEDIMAHMVPQDLVRYGLIPEFVGRIPVVASLSDLGIDDLVEILKRPKNAIIKQFQTLFEMEGVQLTFTREALRTIAQKAIDKKTGARGLRAIIEDLMLDTMFHLPSAKKLASIKVTKRMVEQSELDFKSLKRAVGE